MPPHETAFRIPLNGFAMHLRRAELESVAAGISGLDASDERDLVTLARALNLMPINDRASVWELMIRHWGRDKSLHQAAGEIGMDVIHARDLLKRYSLAIADALQSDDSPAVTRNQD